MFYHQASGSDVAVGVGLVSIIRLDLYLVPQLVTRILWLKPLEVQHFTLNLRGLRVFTRYIYLIFIIIIVINIIISTIKLQGFLCADKLSGRTIGYR